MAERPSSLPPLVLTRRIAGERERSRSCERGRSFDDDDVAVTDVDDDDIEVEVEVEVEEGTLNNNDILLFLVGEFFVGDCVDAGNAIIVLFNQTAANRSMIAEQTNTQHTTHISKTRENNCDDEQVKIWM